MYVSYAHVYVYVQKKLFLLRKKNAPKKGIYLKFKLTQVNVIQQEEKERKKGIFSIEK